MWKCFRCSMCGVAVQSIPRGCWVCAIASHVNLVFIARSFPGKIAPEPPPPPQSKWLSGAKVGQRPLNRIALAHTHTRIYSKKQNGLCVARTRIYNEVYHMCVRVPFSDLSSPAKSCACCSFSWAESKQLKFIAKTYNKFELWIPPCAPRVKKKSRRRESRVPNLITILLNSYN